MWARCSVVTAGASSGGAVSSERVACPTSDGEDIFVWGEWGAGRAGGILCVHSDRDQVAWRSSTLERDRAKEENAPNLQASRKGKNASKTIGKKT